MKDGGQIFFLYDDKHKWSIWGQGNDYTLCFYYNDISIDDLVKYNDEPDSSGFISYNSKEIGTREALESLSDLYHLLTEKLYGIDKVLDDIIKC